MTAHCAVAAEANQSLDRLRNLERLWHHVRERVVGQRRSSRAQETIEMQAARGRSSQKASVIGPVVPHSPDYLARSVQ